MAIEIPASLIERIKTRQTVLVAGMGCCELAGLPGWDDLVERLVGWLDDDARKDEVRALVKAGRQPAATAYLRHKLTPEVVAEVVKDGYPTGKEVPEPLQILGRIPWRGVVTTAWDDTWDRALLGDEKMPTKAFLPRDNAEMTQYRSRFLLHVFGVAGDAGTLCLAPEDVRRKVTPTGAGPFLDEVYRRRSFVFVGFRPGDSDLTMLSERLLGANTHESEHFLLYPGEPGLESDIIQAEYGYTPVPYSGSLEDALRALGDAWTTVEKESRPSEDDIEAWLEIWSRDQSDQEPKDVLARAESRLRDEKKWDRLVDLLLGRMELLADPADHVRTLRDVGQIFETELDAPDKAFTALSTAFHQAPTDWDLVQDLERVAGKASMWNELLAEWSEIVKGISDTPVAVKHWLEMARIYAEEINRDDYAIASFQHVLSLEPKRKEAIEPLLELLRKHERWAELAPILDTAAGLEQDRNKELELRLQIADLSETRLDAGETAIKAYERVLELDAESSESLAALDRLYRKSERWKDLARVLDKRADLARDPQDAVKIRKERADLLADRVNDVDAALATFEAIVADDPMNKGALRSLEKLYDKAGRQEDYLRTLERLCDVAESDGERLLLLRRLAAEWEGRPEGLDRAADALEQILQIDVHDKDAFAALTRVYRNAKRWHALVEATVRQIDASDSPAEKRELYVLVGKLHEDDLRDNARALEAYASAEGLGDDREETLGALARLYEKQESWRPCVDALDKCGRVVKDAAVRTDIFFRAGRIFGEHLDDKAAAEDRYAKALENDPGHMGALSALAALYLGRGEYLRASRLMMEAEQRTQNRIEKTRLLVETGVLYQDRLDDEFRAIDLYTRALSLDPEHVEAGKRLAALHTKRSNWSELEPVLDMLARKVDRASADEAVEILVQLAKTAKQLGNPDKALKAWEQAHAVSPTSRVVLTGFAALRLERLDWREARDLYRQLLAAHQSDMETDEIVETYGRLGKAEVALGEIDTAIGWYEKALGADAHHRPSLEAIARLHGEKGDFAALVLDKKALINEASGDEKAKLWEEMGDLYLNKVKNPVQAISAYQSALDLLPNRRQLLHKLLELYTEHKHWQASADTLVKLADLETSQAVRAKYAYTAAVIHRDELEDKPGAVVLFNRALDDSPDMIKAFDAIERILQEAEDWKDLARNHRKMIKRLPADGLSDLRLRLWNGLGEIALKHLEDRELATTAFEVATSLDRQNVQRHELLAELYVQAGPDKADKAIAEHQFLLGQNPDRLGSYRALAKLYGEIGARDKRFCVAQTLVFLRKADPELQAFFDEAKPPELVPAKRKFSEETWQKLTHGEEDRFIDAIFMLLGQYMAFGSAQQHGQVGLKRKDRVDIGHDDRMPTRALRYVAQTMDLPAPDLFYGGDEKQTLALLNLREKEIMTPAFLVGQALAGKTAEREVVFEVAKRMAFLRPERYVRYALPTPAHIDMALRAALALGGSQVSSGGHNGEVDKLAQQLRKMVPKPVADQLSVVGKKLLQAKGEVIDVPAWLAASDLTASRVGFVLSGDLGAAARVLTGEPSAISPLPAKRRLKDLLAYSVSEDYFAVRKYLGLEIA